MTAGRIVRQRGFALLIVLWVLALVALIATRITAAGHAETRLAGNVRASAIAEEAADGTVFIALFHAAGASGQAWPADGRPHRVDWPQAAAEVTVVDEGGRIPLNTAPAPLLAALLRALGVNAQASTALAAQIVDWRSSSANAAALGAKAAPYRAAGRRYGPANAPLRNVADLRLVLGMTPAIYAALAPHVTPYTTAVPSAPSDSVVAEAIHAAVAGGAPLLSFFEPPTLRIVATAVAKSGARFTRSAVVRVNALDPASAPGDVLQILSWRAETD